MSPRDDLRYVNSVPNKLLPLFMLLAIALYTVGIKCNIFVVEIDKSFDRHRIYDVRKHTVQNRQ